MPFRLEAHGSGSLHQLEGPVPEAQPEHVALVRNQVVPDPQTSHRIEVTVDDAARHVARQCGRGVATVLYGVKRLGLQGPAFRVLGVELSHPGVEVPAVVVEAPLDQFDLRQRLLLEVQKADDDVGDLDAGVVDVVLDLDLAAPAAQHAHVGVAQHGVAQVPDVRGLVRVDAGVLDDDAGPVRSARRARHGPEPLVDVAGERGAVEEEVDESGAGDLGVANAPGLGETRGQLLGDLAGLAPELLGEIEGCRQRQVAELGAGRVLKYDSREIDVEARLDDLAHLVGEPTL